MRVYFKLRLVIQTGLSRFGRGGKLGQSRPFSLGPPVARQKRAGSGWPAIQNGLDIVTRPVLGRVGGSADWLVF